MSKQTKNTSAFHIGLHVSNMKKTVNFYRDLLGTDPVKTKTDYAKFVLEEPALVLTFNEHHTAAPQFGHLGFRVETETELLEIMNRLAGLGHSLREERETSCCYAVQNKFWVTDPDGYEWEVYFFIEDTEENDVRKDACCSVG